MSQSLAWADLRQVDTKYRDCRHRNLNIAVAEVCIVKILDTVVKRYTTLTDMLPNTYFPCQSQWGSVDIAQILKVL